MKNLGETFFARLLGRLVDVVLRHPRWFVWPQVGLAIGCVLLAVFFLKFDTSRNNLVGGNKKYHKIFLEYKQEFPAQDDLVVVAESDDAEKNRQFVERLGAKLEAETNLFTAVFYKGDLKMLGRKALLFVPDSDLEEMHQMLRDYRPFIEQFTRTTNLVSFFNLVNTRFRTAKQEANAENESLVGALPALERILSQARHGLERPGKPPTPGVTALFGGGPEAEQQVYITFGKGHIYLVTAQALREDLNNVAVERMRELMEQTRAEVAGINVGLTGGPVLEHDEMAQSERDTALATVVSLVLVFFIIIFGYGKVSRRIKADGCLLVGMAYTLAFTTLAVGHLNILTITFAPIIVGIAIDFGVHLISRYEEELQHGQSAEAALRRAMIYTGQGIFTGAFTTAGAFLAISFTDFKGIQEMGLISGGGLLICLIPMLTMLPALLLQETPAGGRTAPPAKRPDTRVRLEQMWLKRPGLVLTITLVVSAVCLTQFRKVYFDYNLLNMQSRDLPAVLFEKKLIQSAEKSVLFAAVVADTPQEAVALEEKIRKLPTVAEVESMSRFLVADQTHKLEVIGKIKATVADVKFLDLDTNLVEVPEFSRTLWSLQGYLGAALDATGKDEPALRQQLVSLRETITRLRKDLNLSDTKAATAAVRLADFQQALFADIRDTFQAIQEQDNSKALRPEDLPPALRDRFVGRTGKYLLQVYPKKDVWQRENQQEFVQELRAALDPDQDNRPIITGEPVQLLEYTTLLKESYELAAWYALGAIALLVLIHFRSLVSLILVLVPVCVGAIWLGGFMGFCNIPFNPANIMTLPLVIGIGVTNGIHILNRFAEEQSPAILARSTGKAVFISGLTTIAGFGSLILAEHQGIQSLGYLMAISTATCMVAGLTCLPALLNLLNRKRLVKTR